VEPSAGSIRGAGDLEVPRPLRLLLTAGWSLTESAGLPAAAYLVAAWLDGRDAGLIAGLAAIWLTVVLRKVASGSVPGLLAISAVVLTVQTAMVLATGELWLFLLQFPLANLCMCVLSARRRLARTLPCRNLIRAAHAACWYSWSTPPSRSRRRMSRLAIWSGARSGAGSSWSGRALAMP
jgi:hypothetical protein